MPFKKLVENLISDPTKAQERLIKGCQVIFPDTIFYSGDGNPDLVVSNDKEMCMAHDQKLRITATGPQQHLVLKRLEEICSERYKDKGEFTM